jgi:hypothetical protein
VPKSISAAPAPSADDPDSVHFTVPIARIDAAVTASKREARGRSLPTISLTLAPLTE